MGASHGQNMKKTSPKLTLPPRDNCRKKDDSGPSDGAEESRRDYDSFEREYFRLFPSRPFDEHDSHDGEDVTDDHRERVRHFVDGLDQQVRKNYSAYVELEVLRKEVGCLFRFTERDRPADGLISLYDACAEIAPELSSRECFSRLRSAGILSNNLGHWNQAIGESLESGWLQNQYRVFRVSDGSHRGRFVPYLTPSGIQALKGRLIEILVGDENQESPPPRGRRGKKKIH